MVLVNCQSLYSNINKIKLLIDVCRPIVLFLTETRTTEEMYDAELAIKGYILRKSDAMSRRSGGVAIYFRNDLKFDIIFEKQESYNNYLICDITSQSCSGRFMLIYHSPNEPHEEFLDFIEETLDQYLPESRSLTVLGDFNLCVKKMADLHARRLVRIMKSLGLKQKVSRFTRIAKESKSCIDLLFTNNEMTETEVMKDDMVADH